MAFTEPLTDTLIIKPTTTPIVTEEPGEFLDAVFAREQSKNGHKRFL